MEMLSKLLLGFHVICGSLSIIVFWAPVFTKKGGRIHVLVGKAYVYLMWGVVLSAFILSIENLVQQHYIAASFLGFLTIITSGPLWYGIAILNNKKTLSSFYQRTLLAYHATTVILGVALLVFGIYLKGRDFGILMIIFGILGISGMGDLIKALKNNNTPANWLKEHYTGMIITGIAAYTAFAAFGGRAFLGNIFTGYWMIVPWVAPTVIGIIIIKYMDRGRLSNS